MSDTHAHTVSYVRDTMLGEQAPPVTEVGVIKWVRENLFSSWLNIILTVISLYVVYAVLAAIIPWLSNSIWNAGSLTECRQVLATYGKGSHDGACSAVIRDRWLQLVFGFYPAELYWRPILAFVLLLVALMPVLYSERFPSQMLWFSAIYPFLATWLLWGGAFWTPVLVFAGFFVGYAAYLLGSRFGGQLPGSIAAVAATLLWWLVAVSPLNETLNRIVANARMDTVAEQMGAVADTLPAEIAALETEQEALGTQIAALLAQKDELAASVADAFASGSDVAEERDELLGQFAELTDMRERFNALSVEIFTRQEKLSEARNLRANIAGLPGRIERLPELRETVASLEDNLPDTVRGVGSLQQLENTDAPPDDKRAWSEAQRAKNDLSSVEGIVRDTYANVGRIGLAPVASREFGGFMLAIIIGVAAIVLSLPLGILLALGRQSDLFVINKLSVAFIETIRGVPLIVWLFTAQLLLNYFLPPGNNFDLLLRVIIMVTFFASAYIAEVIRGGLAALPKGQYEAADALGLDYPRAMRLIILPQALKISIPGIVNTFIGLFKDTVLVVFIGLSDPIGFSNLIRASTDWNGIYWELFIFIGVMFFIFCYSMGRYSLYLERKLQREHR